MRIGALSSMLSAAAAVVLIIVVGCGSSPSAPAAESIPVPMPFRASGLNSEATPLPADAVTTPTQAWERILSAFEAAADRLDQGQAGDASRLLLGAKRGYVQQFQEAALFVALDSHWRVGAIFRDAEAAVSAGDATSLSRTRAEMDAALIAIAFEAMQDALAREDVGEMITWYSVMTRKFHLRERPSVLNILVSEARRSPALLGDLRDRIGAALFLFLVERIQARTDQALDKLATGDTLAAKTALDATLLYTVIQPRVREELGEEEEEQVGGALERLRDAVQSGELAKARDAADAVRPQLGELVEQLQVRVEMVRN